jgi:hypothetical protein
MPYQFDFLLPDEPNETKGMGLWGAAPWTVIDRPSEYARGEKMVDTIQRTFSYRGQFYNLSMLPARIEEDGVKKEFFPGDRERRIEILIRKIAIDNRAFNLESNKIVSVTLRAADIFNELAAIQHGATYAEILRSIEIMAGTRLTITRADDSIPGRKREAAMATNIFPTVKILKEENEEFQSETMFYLQFNDLIADAIRTIDLHTLDFKTEIKLNLRAWVVFRYINNALYADEIGPDHKVVITGSQIHEGCGTVQVGRKDRDIARMTNSLQQLVDQNICASIERQDITKRTGGRPALVDVRFVLTISDEFWAQTVKNRRGLRGSHERFERITGQKAPPKAWAHLTPAQRRATALEQTTLDLPASSA